MELCSQFQACVREE